MRAAERSIYKRLQTLDFSKRTADTDADTFPTGELAPGEVIDHYRLLEQLGSGGFGHIYRALDERLEREVAIKLAIEAIAADPEAMVREARALAALNHPNVVTVYEVAVHQNCPYIAMELLRGESLRARIDRTRPTLVHALSWAAEILRGLSAAHNADIVHLDVKPDNVFLTKDGVVKLIDFGVARKNRAGAYEGENVIGTAAYMAPEQLLGDPLDFRADLFSFGVVLHELVTGTHPFLRPHLAATMQALMNGDFFQNGRVSDPEVEAIVRQCMQLEPAQRPPSAAHVLQDLERVLRARTQIISRTSQVAYVETDHGNIAYQCTGTSPGFQMLVVPGLLSRCDVWYDEPEGAAFLRTLTDAGRIVLFDRAGLGASDRLSETALPTIDEEVDHLDTILDAAAIDRAVLLAFDTGTPLATLYAAVRPERVAGLIIVSGSPGYDDNEIRASLRTRLEHWGTEQSASLCAPTLAQETRTAKWIAAWERATSSPKIMRARVARLERTDTVELLPFILCPTFVLHRIDDSFCSSVHSLPFQTVSESKRMVLPGQDHLAFAGPQDIAPQIVRFARDCDHNRPAEDERFTLVTWLLTDMSCDDLPQKLRPRQLLERRDKRLLRVDRPGSTKRWLDTLTPGKTKAVLACTPHAEAVAVFDKLEPLFIELESERIKITHLSQRILEGTTYSPAATQAVPSIKSPSDPSALPDVIPPDATTTIAAAHSKRETSPTGTSLRRMSRLGAVALGCAAVVGFVSFGKKNEPGSLVTAPAAPTDTPRKTTHLLTLESEPVGAMVKEGAREWGKTPLEVILDESEKTARTFTFSKDGYSDHTLLQEPATADVHFTARLSKLETLPPANSVATVQPTASAVNKRIAPPKPRMPTTAPTETATDMPMPSGTLDIKRRR